MRVLYDAQIFLAQKHGGISRYYYELACFSGSDIETEIAVLYHRNEYLGKISKSLPFPQGVDSFLGGKSFPGRGVLFNLKEKIRPSIVPKKENEKILLKKIVLEKPDIFHPTYYNNYFLDNIKSIPFVLTIYDMIHEIYPEYFIGDKTAFLKRQLFDKAQQVIAISETTKNDILEIYNCPEKKIDVVHLASSLCPQQNISKGTKYPEKFILFVGDRWIYKNFLFFVTAISPLLKNDEDLYLVCTGRPFNEKEIEFFAQNDISRKILQISASDEELATLYGNARVFVFPSLYEGFGLPVLESFACNCPVVLSNTGSLLEIAGDAALYFEPKSTSDIRNAVDKVLTSPSLRADLIYKGVQRLKKYSWTKTVEKTHEIYRKIIQ
jgi:glycosyltransferase involved in cell wall biosynthesis